jgi:primosomal protein N' (replication factor Y)
MREERALRESPPYPPTTALVNLLVSGAREAEVGRRSAEVAEWCGALIERFALPVELLGPAPCPLARIKDRWRWHVLLKGTPEALGRIVRYAAGRLTGGAGPRVVIDRDPVSLL